ncbi:hypothetical protein [Desulfothermus sp.]
MKIIINGFGNIYFELKKRYGKGVNIILYVPEGVSAEDIISILNIDTEDIEGIFINGEVKSTSSELKDGDRIGLIPKGIPGPYRFLLGIKKLKK